MTDTQPVLTSDSFVELHQYLRQLISPEQEARRGEPDFARVEAYWHIGRIIVETEQQGQGRADYGVHLVEQLSKDLTWYYGKGYKTSNLWWFKQFYLAFPILHALRGELVDIRGVLRIELTWTHYRLLIAIADKQERHFYLHHAADQRWSYRSLNRLIKSRYYYQVALGEDQLLAREQISSKKISNDEKRRSRIAQARQTLLSQLGWALTDRVASGLPMTVAKPDILFYHYTLQRFIGLWADEKNSTVLENIRRQVGEWKLAQPVSVTNFPLALLLTAKNELEIVTTASTPPLSDTDRSCLPDRL